jgi:hypothetical protein
VGRCGGIRSKKGIGAEPAAAASTILRCCASRHATRSLTEQVAGDIDYSKTPPFLCVRFKICLHKDLNSFLAGINVDMNG